MATPTLPTPTGLRIPLLRTAFVIYNHANLPVARTFLLDFGLTIASETPEQIFFRGYGTEPFIYLARQSHDSTSYFGGAAYEVPSRSDLERAVQECSGCTKIQAFEGEGGGEFVTLTDPAGHLVHLIHGQTKNTHPKLPSCLAIPSPATNYEFFDTKPRRGEFQRFEPGPAPVHRWGHYGVTYPPGMYEKMYAWYTQNLSLAPSDVVYKNGAAVTCFFHIDRGMEFTDHHAFFFKTAKVRTREVGIVWGIMMTDLIWGIGG